MVVVSAMSGETNRLLKLAKQITDDPRRARGRRDRVDRRAGHASACVALAIQRGGRQGAVAPRPPGASILTDSAFTRARIQVDRRARRSRDALDERQDRRRSPASRASTSDGNITTLGRGGSDTTGVAIAAALEGRRLRDLHRRRRRLHRPTRTSCRNARKIERISYEEMLELASLGAKVLQIRSVEFGMKYGVPIHVRSSFNDNEGTWVVPEEKADGTVLVVAASPRRRTRPRSPCTGSPTRRASQAKVFRPLADAGIVVDMIVQSAHPATAAPNLTFTLPAATWQARARHPDQAVRATSAPAERIKSDDAICRRSRSSASACARTPASR